MKKEYITSSPVETETVAAALGAKLIPGVSVALFGGLGAGKTAFTRGLARGVGYTGEVTSPTFAIVHEYRGGRADIYHFDMYRIENFDDLYSAGYFEYEALGGIIVTEWSENIENALPERYIRVEIEQTGESERKIIIDDDYTHEQVF